MEKQEVSRSETLEETWIPIPKTQKCSSEEKKKYQVILHSNQTHTALWRKKRQTLQLPSSPSFPRKGSLKNKRENLLLSLLGVKYGDAIAKLYNEQAKDILLTKMPKYV